jgi:ATP-dependent helicase/nuclease subunit A
VDWAVRQIENEADVLETVVPELDDDAVRILTVHGSKGLDFPITIVSGLASMGGRPTNLVWDDTGKPQIRLKKDVLETAGTPTPTSATIRSRSWSQRDCSTSH